MSYSNLAPQLGPDQYGADSPSSSVFDLPTQPSRPTHAPIATGNTSGNAFCDIASQKENPPSFLVISGGTGCNSICAAFGGNACYVLPVSDDGGSSSEIIRVLGGPSIGTSPCWVDMRYSTVCAKAIYGRVSCA